MIDVLNLLEEIKAEPYREVEIKSPHTGIITFNKLKEGDAVYSARGTYKEIPATSLATITRENNPQPIRTNEKGQLSKIFTEYEGQFVEAGTTLATVKHFLSKREVVDIILKKSLFLFNAPERATYYFTQENDTKIKISGCRAITVHDGMDLFIMSRMKREVPLAYQGIEGIIYAVYFSNTPVDAGTPLIAICPASQAASIEDVIEQVRRNWKENEF